MYLVGFCYNRCCESVIQLSMVFMIVVSGGCDYSWISTVFLVVLVVWFWLVGCVCFFVENGWGWRVECLVVDDRICNDGRNVGGLF